MTAKRGLNERWILWEIVIILLWIPAFAGMTKVLCHYTWLDLLSQHFQGCLGSFFFDGKAGAFKEEFLDNGFLFGADRDEN